MKFADKSTVKFNDHQLSVSILRRMYLLVSLLNSGPESGIGVTMSKISVGWERN